MGRLMLQMDHHTWPASSHRGHYVLRTDIPWDEVQRMHAQPEVAADLAGTACPDADGDSFQSREQPQQQGDQRQLDDGQQQKQRQRSKDDQAAGYALLVCNLPQDITEDQLLAYFRCRAAACMPACSAVGSTCCFGHVYSMLPHAKFTADATACVWCHRPYIPRTPPRLAAGGAGTGAVPGDPSVRLMTPSACDTAVCAGSGTPVPLLPA